MKKQRKSEQFTTEEHPRVAEAKFYDQLYAKDPKYRMGVSRSAQSMRAVHRLMASSGGGSFLDVGTGRGELLAHAREAGFSPVVGTEAAESLTNGDTVVHAFAHALPFEDYQFDHVFCCDVLEHLLPEDVDTAIAELWRVAKSTLTISAATRPSLWPGTGRDLHPSARPVEQWQAAFNRVIGQDVAPCASFGDSPVWRFLRYDNWA